MKKQLQELLENNIIDEATAARIRAYYETKQEKLIAPAGTLQEETAR